MKKMVVILTLVFAVFVVSIPNAPAQPVDDTILACVEVGGHLMRWVSDPKFCQPPSFLIKWNVGIDPAKIYVKQCVNSGQCLCTDPDNDRLLTGGAECTVGTLSVSSPVIIDGTANTTWFNAWAAECVTGTTQHDVVINIECVKP